MAQDVIFARPEGGKEISLSQIENLTLGLEGSIIVWRRNQDKIFALVSNMNRTFNWYIARVDEQLVNTKEVELRSFSPRKEG
jgi:hypothetical protein